MLYAPGGAASPDCSTCGPAHLDNWRTATGQDANSISADPQFVSTTDLHITDTSSPAGNVATPIAGITIDIDGTTRDAATPDIGADEFVRSERRDAGQLRRRGTLPVALPLAAVLAGLAVVALLRRRRA